MTTLYPLLLYIVVTTFTPGPNNILSMTHAMRAGYRRTLSFLLGITSGFAVIMLICGVLNAVLADRLPQIQFWLNLAGAGYMIYLGVHTILSKPDGNGDQHDEMNNFRGGLLLQFLNMKVILYGITVYALFITRISHDFMVTVLSAFALAVIGFVSISCWALGGSVFRVFWQKHYRLFNWVMGGLLIYLAVHSLLT
jgi:cysteine/O-acetylserine efflux protein